HIGNRGRRAGGRAPSASARHPTARSWSAMRTPVALESLVSAVCTIPPPLSDTAIFARRAVVYVWKMLSPSSRQDPRQTLSAQVNGAFASKAPAQPLDRRRPRLAPAAGAHELIELAVERTESHRIMALSLFEMRPGTGNPRRKPLAVGHRHARISGSVPDHDRNRDLPQVETPRSGQRQVVVDPPVHARAQRLAAVGGEVLPQLTSQRGPVGAGEQRRPQRGNTA